MMKKFVWLRWRNWSFAYKLIIIYIPLIVLPSVIGLVILTESYNQASKEEITQHSKVIIDLTADKIDTQISEYDDITLKLITTPEISQLLSKNPTNKFEQIEMQRKLESYVKPIVGEIDTKDIVACVFVTKDGRYVIGNDSRNDYFDSEQTFKNVINEKRGAPVWLNPHFFTINQKELKVFRVGRTIKNYAYQPVGIVYLVINSNWLENILINQVGPEVQLEVVDSLGQHVSGETLPFTEDTDEWSMVKTKYNNWSIVTKYSFDELYESISDMSRFSRGLIVICTLIGLIATYILVMDLIVPIRRMRINMNRGIKGVRPEKMIKFNGAKEICELNDLFISVMYDIYNLMEKGKENEKLKRKFEIKLLQRQLSPHFLYNTLNSIRWIAMIKKQNQIKGLVDALSRLLSYSLRNTDELVSLEEELSIIKEYVKIQKVRYQDFNFVIDIGTKIDDLKILKFLLQPLIENALIHGLSNIEGFGEIILSITMENKILYISVIDNGVGIASDRLSYIQDILNGESLDKHIGLKSIHERIKASYGINYGLNITSEVDKGTTMEVKLPIIRNGE
ncbi:histidine kinase [Metabacillus sp. BG109]|uniref:Histidine kinase n=2 Tax=Metabacillus bambusae TaxID=2795218 RepID=A0ABS3MZT1_9BACI|nr:histidine kinase [Metabacillus bambusae]